MKLSEPFAAFVAQTHQPTALTGDPRFPDAAHAWSDGERAAIVQAWATGRPLLVRGEPGCGKSQLARAAAAVLGVEIEVDVVHPRFEAKDLEYRIDHVRRLAYAQMLGALGATPSEKGSTGQGSMTLEQLVDHHLGSDRFVEKGVLWRAMEHGQPAEGKPAPPLNRPCAVALIDEIDKADADVPNGLLGILGNRSLVKPSGDALTCAADTFPLVVVTTNEDRELPPAFLRRCVVLNLQPQTDNDQAFQQWMLERARAHPQLRPIDHTEHGVFEAAAEQTLKDRRIAEGKGLPTVGLAECLDLLYGLLKLSNGDPGRARELMDEVSAFVLVKQRDLDQRRPAIARATVPRATASDPRP